MGVVMDNVVGGGVVSLIGGVVAVVAAIKFCNEIYNFCKRTVCTAGSYTAIL